MVEAMFFCYYFVLGEEPEVSLQDYIDLLNKHNVIIHENSINMFYNARMELMNFANNSKKLLLYGSGKWGKACALLLEGLNVKYKGFAVTKSDDNSSILGHSIIEIGSIKRPQDYSVIVCIAAPSTSESIKSTLNQMGIGHIYDFHRPVFQPSPILEPVSGSVKFSVLMPVYNVNIKYLKIAVESIVAQNYLNWELCIVDDNSTDKEVIKYLKTLKDERINLKLLKKNHGISEATNRAALIASGDYYLFMDNDDKISTDALYWFYKMILEKKPDVLYSDMDLINEEEQHFNPYFKPDWSPDLLRSQMYIGHLLGVKADIFKEIGGFRKEYDGAQDYDLMLRLSNRTDRIEHIDKILYSWRSLPTSTALNADSKPYAQTAGLSAIKDCIVKSKDSENVEGVYETDNLFVYDVRYSLNNNPLVSIIIPTKDHVSDLKKVINSILEKSTYQNYEIIILNNNSEKEITYQYFRRISRSHSNIKVEDASYAFNWSRLTNHGINVASGEVFILLNNDVEIITHDWIERLASNALRPGIGMVGALLFYPDETIQHGGVVVGIGGWADHLYKGMKAEHLGTPFISPILTRNVSAVTGACMAFSRATYELLGSFDESFIICGSDVEYCLRAIEHGLYNVYNPFVKAFHYESKSRKNIAIPDVDFKRSYEVYKPYRDYGDPFYNNNLDYRYCVPKVALMYHNESPKSKRFIGELRELDLKKSSFKPIRINLLIPSICDEDIFGGISTALVFFKNIVETGGYASRLIVTDKLPSKEAVSKWRKKNYRFVASFEECAEKKQIISLFPDERGTIPTGESDIFVATAWWTANAIQSAYDRWKAKGEKCNPIIYLIQDYEPGFYAWSTQYLLAEATYKSDHDHIAIFNSKYLYDFFKNNKYRFFKEFYFDPTLNSSLKRSLQECGAAFTKEKIILVYGRPNTPRNAFPLLMQGLLNWADSYPNSNEWRVISAGQAQDSVRLTDSVVVESVGKLSLDEYADVLKRAYAGISLMVSPHPSYPPLEMAAFGVKVITNSYANKDLCEFSENIISLDSVTPQSIADSLCAICDKFEEKCPLDNSNCYEYINGEIDYSFVEDIVKLLNGDN